MPIILDAKGEQADVTLEPTLYKEAHDANLTVPQLINRKFATNDEKYGSAFSQLCASSGLILRADADFGLRTPNMADIFNGAAEIQAGAVIKDANPASRILFPAVILELVENKLKVDRTSGPAVFDRMIALDQTIAGERYEQPVINYDNQPTGDSPEGARSQAISQLAKPPAMMTITTADVAKKIPTFSLGMEISDQAMKASTLDLITLAVARQAEIERASRVDEYIGDILTGDVDTGQAALSAATGQSYDAAITTAGTLTQKAWMKYLYHNHTKRVIDWVICDINAALAIEARTGKPVITGDDPNSPRIDALFNIANPGWGDVNIFLVEEGVVAANTILGLDSRYAITRIRNSEAEYQAVEDFVMRRGRGIRFDFGEIVYRQFDDAFDVMTLTVA